MSKVLVTGGCGFIGSHVIDELLTDNNVKEIINIDKLGVGSDINNVAVDPRITNYYIDICNDEIYNIFEKHKPEYIIHLAAESHVDRSIANPLSFVNSNVMGTGNILEGMRRYVPKARMVHVSTDEVYGHLNHDDYPFLEDTPMNPRSPYSASKAGSDMLAFSYKSTYGLDITVTKDFKILT
ncbi:MAG: GDP-mannose 4,6-dehydratase [Minisyncoccia bacterium]